MFLISSPAG